MLEMGWRTTKPQVELWGGREGNALGAGSVMVVAVGE